MTEKKEIDVTLREPGEFHLEQGMDTPEAMEEALKLVGEVYDGIKMVLTKYLDMPEEAKTIVALWCIGTYTHKEFSTYPFLFINAMRGSGKTRLLRLIEYLSWNGKLTNSMTEAVLFRTAESHTILIDEFESVGSKEKQAIRELLNSAYKKGTKIERMKKKHSKEGDEMVVEQFGMYTPISIANIWGMEEVLGDRCIPIILEKSSNPQKTRMMENFEEDMDIYILKKALRRLEWSLWSYVSKKNIRIKWNNYITYIYTQTPLTPLTTLTSLQKKMGSDLKLDELSTRNEGVKLEPDEMALFDLIHATGLDGRNLELYFPLIVIATAIREDLVKEILKIASEMTEEKRRDELLESDDVSFIDFISQLEIGPFDYILINELTSRFRIFVGLAEKDLEKINPKWTGRALRRLGLVTAKKKTNRGNAVIPNVEKAKEKIERYRDEKI